MAPCSKRRSKNSHWSSLNGQTVLEVKPKLYTLTGTSLKRVLSEAMTYERFWVGL